MYLSETSYFQGILMAPLGDFCKGQFVGVLSALDFIMIVRELSNHGSILMEEELETHTISAWKDAKSYLSKQIDGNERLFPRQLFHVSFYLWHVNESPGMSRFCLLTFMLVVQAGPDKNLKDVALKILQNNVATVSVIHSSSGNASIPQLLHLASLSGILKCICRYFKHSFGTLPMLQLPICAIPLGTWVSGIRETNRWPLAMLRPRSSLGLALSLLVQAQVSSIPIVDDNDSLLNVYSQSDINALAKDKIYTHINLEEMTINQSSPEPDPSLPQINLIPLIEEQEMAKKRAVRALITEQSFAEVQTKQASSSQSYEIVVALPTTRGTMSRPNKCTYTSSIELQHLVDEEETVLPGASVPFLFSLLPGLILGLGLFIQVWIKIFASNVECPAMGVALSLRHLPPFPQLSRSGKPNGIILPTGHSGIELKPTRGDVAGGRRPLNLLDFALMAYNFQFDALFIMEGATVPIIVVPLRFSQLG
ncbi:hypothetical protein HYC85_002869 [Camellia sinensis]|uniref:CBS domain-containing protein n=1 Tax=Camellia sinensis TaxID=4442 RepID=A0A7J7I9J7_CAMSI|nr:hypothetical protein HYC85_002869 [Camellia sinensis]